MALDKTKLEHTSVESWAVYPRTGMKKGGYNLSLHEEKDNQYEQVLVVTLRLRFEFLNNANGAAWTEESSAKFKKDYVKYVEESWANKFKIQTMDLTVSKRKIRVEFDIQTDATQLTNHYVIKATALKEGDKITSQVFWTDNENYKAKAGDVQLDEQDTVLEEKEVNSKKYKQRGLAHEFGHMLGLRDEYDLAIDDPRYDSVNHNWPNDNESIMNAGMKVQARHYALLARDVTKKLEKIVERDYDYRVTDAEGYLIGMTEAKL